MLLPRARQPEARLLEAVVQSVRNLSETLYLLDLAGFPADFDPRPGQFLHLRASTTDHPLLRRPISIQCWRQGVATLLIREVGIGTRLLHLCHPGDTVDVLGPLGTGFSPIAAGESVLMVGGGVGVAPLLACCTQAPEGSLVDFCFGVATGAELQGTEDFKECSDRIRFHISTDDGTAGYRGYCTDVAARLLGEQSYTKVFTCGPWVMMKKTVEAASVRAIPVEASLEVQMGCGLGACLGCVYETPEGEFIRSCIDGPVVDGREVRWDKR
jgi:dihydroorotate dehydrogenase electron transfer subunit